MSTIALLTHPDCLAHGADWHPERPARLQAIWDALQAAPLDGNVSWQTPSPATLDQVRRVHAERLIIEVRELASRGGGMIGLDTVVSRRSFDAALLSAGAAVQAALLAWDRPGWRAFALGRPPGHHATTDEAMGFCLFNNVAIAARAVIAERHAQRVAIVDVDVHHGNGTQEIFWNDPRVLFCSLHQFPLYPGTGRAEEVGAVDGLGQIINVPLPPGCGDVAYRRAFARVVEPAVRRFRPEIILVSAGFDAHWADAFQTEGTRMRLSTSGYVAMIRSLASLADELCEGGLALTLEGGYDLDALSSSVAAVAVALAGGEPRDRLGPSPDGVIDNVEPILDRVCLIHGL